MRLSMRRAMPRADLDILRDRLLHSGIAPRYVARAVSELGDHFEDVESEAAEHGAARETAIAQAAERIGAMEYIAQQYVSRPEMKSWPYRHPRLARVLLPMAYVLLLPAMPIYTGIKYAPFIGKWCASFVLGGLVTVALLLLMQMSIVLT